MYSIIKYRSFWDEEIDFNLMPDPDGFVTCESLTHDITPRSSRRGKSERHGSWPTFTYFESMSITLEGQVIASTLEAFNIFSTRMTQILMPEPLLPLEARNQGTFIIQKIGLNASWQIPATCEIIQMPIAAPAYSRAPYHLSFYAPRPFYFEPANNRYYWHP